MANFPIKDDTKKQVSLVNESQQSPDEQLNLQLANTNLERNQQSSWQELRAIPDFNNVFTRDSLVQHAAVPIKLRGPSYQAILAILDKLHSSSGSKQIENALILKNQIQHYQEHHASSGRNSALTMLNQQIDKELFSSPLPDQAKILYTAQQNPQLASQMYQSAFNEALGSHSIRSVGIPEKLHFIWQGKLAAIQQDYINAWHQTNPDYQIKIWYDPQASLEKRYKDSNDISERAIIKDAFGRSKNISVIVSQQEKLLKRRISPKVYELLSTLNSKQLNNNTLNEIAPFDDKLVDDWDKPQINFQRENSQTRFDGQLIIQLENDRVVRESATRLVGKHPETSVLVQLDRQGNFRVWHLNPTGEWGEGFPEKFTMNGSLHWQVVGHSRNSDIELSRQMLGGRSAEILKKQLIEFSSIFGINSFPKRISLMGCSLAGKDQENSYLHQFVSFLNERDLYPSSVAAYTNKVTVNEDNQKRLTQIGEKVVMNREGREWVTTRIPGKNDSSVSQRQLLDSLNQNLAFEQGMTLLYLKNQLSNAE